MEGAWVPNRERRSLPLTVPTPRPGAVRKTWSEGFLHLRGCTDSQSQRCTCEEQGLKPLARYSDAGEGTGRKSTNE